VIDDATSRSGATCRASFDETQGQTSQIAQETRPAHTEMGAVIAAIEVVADEVKAKRRSQKLNRVTG
jgi:hypothetical protein